MSYIYLAKWILLPSFEILTNGAIVIDGDKIKEVGSRSKISKKKDDIIINLNDTFLLIFYFLSQLLLFYLHLLQLPHW